MAGSKNRDIVGFSSLTDELFQELFQLLQPCNGTLPILVSTDKSSVVYFLQLFDCTRFFCKLSRFASHCDGNQLVELQG